ncbi:hypothetical protein, partial [Escherichia coli]|uniref:hypothetical protein n=3 Tax=Enterobacteriaceae TaxID=543 RepID=UPI001BFCBE75
RWPHCPFPSAFYSALSRSSPCFPPPSFRRPSGQTGDRIAMPPAGHYQDDSVLTRLCYAKSFGQQAARRSKSTAVWQVEGVAPRHPPPLPSLFYPVSRQG